MKALGGKVGLEFETNSTRPSAAKSSAGVFGGLIAATVSCCSPLLLNHSSLTFSLVALSSRGTSLVSLLLLEPRFVASLALSPASRF